jgi:hypothetical protein
MRAAALPILTLPLLLSYCGAKQDLLIGEIALVAEAGSSSSAGGSVGAEPGVGGSLAAAAGAGGTGAAGSAAVGGEGGDAVTAGAGGEGLTEDCVKGDPPPLGNLIHRYSFVGTDGVLVDSIGGADGNTVGGVMLDGTPTGTLTLSGVKGQYANLPNGLVSSLTDVTIVTWLTWTGGAGYQRIFDFGISDKGEVIGGNGRSYFAAIPLTGFENNTARGLGAEIKVPGLDDSIQIASHEPMEDRYAQVAFVFQSGKRIALYLNSVLLGEVATPITLAEIDDRNNWLGQSQWDRDPAFQGVFEEFRIYDVALTGCQLETTVLWGAERIE